MQARPHLPKKDLPLQGPQQDSDDSEGKGPKHQNERSNQKVEDPFKYAIREH
jgi:hypothetical protein